MGVAAKALATAALLAVHVYGFVAHQSLTALQPTRLQAESGADTLPSFSSRRSQTDSAIGQTEMQQVGDLLVNEPHSMHTSHVSSSSVSVCCFLALQTLYEEDSKFADPFAVATECMIQITSAEHLDRVLTTAGGAVAGYTGYEDAQGNWRNPHKLVMIEVYANWCRACLGVTPKLLKMCAQHPEVLCCKLNKGDLEVRMQYMFTFDCFIAGASEHIFCMNSQASCRHSAAIC